jgi:hypothetical protein
MSDSNIKPLHAPGPNAQIVELLERLLDDAKSGRLLGLCVVTEVQGGGVGTALEFFDVHRAIGGSVRLQKRLLETPGDG